MLWSAGNVCLVLVALLAYGTHWFYNTPIPHGYKDPWELRKTMANIRWSQLKASLWERNEDQREIWIARRGDESGPPPDPQLAEIKVKTEDLVLDGVKVRLYVPESRLEDALSPGVVFFHGGCFIIGSVKSYDQFCKSFAHGAQVKIISVDYRRAPEHLFPAAQEDCVTASRYTLLHAEHLGIDPARLAIAGDSAGGNLAASTVLKLRDLKIEPQPKLQVLIVPMLQALDFQTSSYQLFSDDPLLPRQFIASSYLLYAFGNATYTDDLLSNRHTTTEIKQKYLNKQLNPDHIPEKLRGQHFTTVPNNFGDENIWDEIKDVFLDPYFSPLLAEDLSGLPETVVMGMGQDVLRDEGILYANYMERFGVKVRHVLYEAGYHGMVTWPVEFQENVYKAREMLYKLVRDTL